MSENTPETMYESKGKTPNGKPFMSVKRARGYYEYAERGGQDSIFFILYDKKNDKWALINEAKPPLDERQNTKVMMKTAFGGSIDMDNKTPQEICQVEVLEEAGYDVSLDNITFVGKTLVSSQMSQMALGYFVEVTGIEKTHKAEYELDVSETQHLKDPDEFSRNSVFWMTPEELVENSDWKSIFIMTQSAYKNLV